MIAVPAMTLKKLLRRSLVEGRSVSNLAAFLLEQTLEGGHGINSIALLVVAS